MKASIFIVSLVQLCLTSILLAEDSWLTMPSNCRFGFSNYSCPIGPEGSTFIADVSNVSGAYTVINFFYKGGCLSGEAIAPSGRSYEMVSKMRARSSYLLAGASIPMVPASVDPIDLYSTGRWVFNIRSDKKMNVTVLFHFNTVCDNYSCGIDLSDLPDYECR